MRLRFLLNQMCRRFTASKRAGRSSSTRFGRIASSPEPLEARVAPAALINSSTLEYKDSAGDVVTVKFAHPLFNLTDAATNLANANICFKFDTGNVSAGPFDAATAAPQQLQLVDLADLPLLLAPGLSFSVTAAHHAGTANIGYVNASGLAIGTVKIDGDLGRINAGASGKFGLQALDVVSIGALGTATQAASGASLASTITGVLGSLHVAGDVTGASIVDQNVYDFFGDITGHAAIHSITIGGSLIGASAVGTASDQTGFIGCDGLIDAVKIGTTLSNGIVGGGGADSGRIFAASAISSVKISGTVSGGPGDSSGTVYGQFGLGALTIGGNLVAGTGSGSGLVSSSGNLGQVTIHGNIDATVSGVGQDSGGLQAGGSIRGVTMTGSLEGGGSVQSGFIDAGTAIGPIALQSIGGGSAQDAGTITAGGQIVSISVLEGLTGGSGAGSGSIFSGMDIQLSGAIGSVKIGGALSGGSGASSGMIDAGGRIAAISVGAAAPGNAALLSGGGGDFSGSILSQGGIGSVKITGNVEGGVGSFSGAIVSHDLLTPAFNEGGDLGSVVITGGVQGGAGNDSGEIRADGNLAKFAAASLAGSTGMKSGSLLVGQGILHPGAAGPIQIKGAMTAGSGTESGSIIAESSIAKLTVAGAATGGTIRSGDSIGALTFESGVSDFVISARGAVKPTAKTDVAIGKLTVNGNVAQTEFLAGYDTALDPSNPDAQIGPVFVKGNWTASDLVAGVTDGAAAGFGTAADAPIAGVQPPGLLSELVSVVITGTVTGTASPGDHFGFSAEKIGVFSADGKKLGFTQAGQSFELDAVNNDVTAREVPD